MPGYQILEDANLQPRKARGVAPIGETVGILDFLRELAEEDVPFSKFTQLRLVGVEDVLFAARPNERELAIEIHRRLNEAAGDLERKLMEIQVVFQGRIIRGADMNLDFRGATLPIGLIFNHPAPRRDGNGNTTYPMEFHLSSP